ncbi:MULTISPECIES: JmjC domain-containing protein [Hyphobacterium]|uniref:JmjC domain-containing protein n=1 Tax=Hyphobacterium vulgare TaxID=1736751 RepID=A0ABV7A0F5_9PROT
MSQFADLIAPFSEDEFFAEYYGKKPLHIQRPGADVSSILTWDSFNDALEQTPFWTDQSLRIAFNNHPAPPESFCTPVETLEGHTINRADPARVKALVGVGATLVANRIHEVSPGVRRAAKAIHDRTQAAIAANVYCSFKGVQAFQSHYDLHDVFVVQVEGEKTWNIWTGREDRPISHVGPGDAGAAYLMRQRGSLMWQIRMKPGDVLYLPRGQYHDALAEDGATLHVTFSIAPLTGFVLFDMLKEEARHDALFRDYIPSHDVDHGGAMRAHLERLADRIREIAASPLIAEEIAGKQREKRIGLAGYGLPETRAPHFYAVAGLACEMSRRDAGYVLVGPGGEIALGAAHRAVDWLLRQRQFSEEELIARFPQAAPEHLQQLLGTLESQGYVERAALPGQR